MEDENKREIADEKFEPTAAVPFAADTNPYSSEWTGEEVDEAVKRVLKAGTLDSPLATTNYVNNQINEALEGFEGGGGESDVTSVNGKTGAVVLTYEDVNAAPLEDFERIRNIVDEMTYKAPTISLTLEYTGSTASVDLSSDGPYERKVSVTGFKYSTTQTGEFTDNLTFKHGEDNVLTEIDPYGSSATISPISLTFTSTTATTKTESFTLSGPSKKSGTIYDTKNISVSFYFPRYYGVTTKETLENLLQYSHLRFQVFPW